MKGARVTVAWTDPIGTRYDEPLTGYRLKSYLYDETEFDIPCDSSGAPTAYAHVGQVLLVNEGKIFMEFGMGASTKEAPIVRVALRIEHDQGVYNGILVFTFHEPMGFDTMLIQGNQASSATRSETSHT